MINNSLENNQTILDYESPSTDELILDGTKMAWHLDRVKAWEKGERVAPITIDIAITRSCNYGCHFCYAMTQENDRTVISKEHKDKIENYIAKGIEEGATLIADGRNFKIQGYENGYFIGPTLFDNVTNNMTIYKEEIFGPVLSVVRTKNYEEAITLINEHPFGNGTSIYTSDGEVARHFTTNSKIGMVGVNVPIPVPMAFHSFGGWKQSLFGDHSMHGMEGIHFYTKLKTITSRWPKSIQSGPEFKMPTN